MLTNSSIHLLIGLIMMGHIHEITVDSLNEQKTQENLGEKENSPWHRNKQSMYVVDKYARDRVMKSARLLLPYLKDNDLILDIGCFSQEARKYFPPWVSYLGIDQVAYHPQTRVVELNHGFVPIPCQKALCLETLEHLVTPEKTLESIYNSLTNDSLLVVSVPNEATLFHRLRCLCGTVDAECFSSQGKHLHLPNLKASRTLVSKYFEIVKEEYYISPSAQGSRHSWVGSVIGIVPVGVHQFLADAIPSLFARGFIFLLRKKAKHIDQL